MTVMLTPKGGFALQLVRSALPPYWIRKKLFNLSESKL